VKVTASIATSESSSSTSTSQSIDLTKSMPNFAVATRPAPPAFSNGFPVASTSVSNPPSSSFPNSTTAPTLNPKAPEFKPPQTSKPSSFAQWASAPPVIVNGNNSIPADARSNILPPPTFTPPTTSLPKTSPTLTQTQPSTTFFTQAKSVTAGLVTPPLNRPSAPPLLKINTNTSSGSSSSSAASPRVPPALPRVQPVSLPSTPAVQLQPPSALPGHLRHTLESRTSFSNSSQEILSPLFIATPTTSNSKPFHNFTPLSTPQSSKIFRASSPPSSSHGKGKAPDRTMYDDLEGVEEMKRKALAFARTSLLVKEIFSRWVKRATAKAAWLEACRHSDDYRKKLMAQSQNSSRQPSLLRSSRQGTPLEKKRRISANGSSLPDPEASPHKKRARKRMSTEYRPPRTDEELAKRFKEVQNISVVIRCCRLDLTGFFFTLLAIPLIPLFLRVHATRITTSTNSDGPKDPSYR